MTEELKLTENRVNLMFEVYGEFDFEKVHSVMEFLGWQWATCNGVPDACDIRREGAELLKQAVMSGVAEKSDMTVATGGLEAKYYYSENEEEEGLQLRFVLEDAGTV